MEEIFDKKYIVAIKHDGKDVFYNRVDGKDVEFVGIRSKAHHFENEGGATFVKMFLKGNGYDAWVEPFYVIKEELKTD